MLGFALAFPEHSSLTFGSGDHIQEAHGGLHLKVGREYKRRYRRPEESSALNTIFPKCSKESVTHLGV